jgi:hypothetical protein
MKTDQAKAAIGRLLALLVEVPDTAAVTITVHRVPTDMGIGMTLGELRRMVAEAANRHTALVLLHEQLSNARALVKRTLEG